MDSEWYKYPKKLFTILTVTSTSLSNMLSFIKSERSKPKLSYGGFLYNYHREKSSGSITWRCEINSKHYRDLGISCSSTASTTGTFPTSTLEWARDHTHPPDNSKIKARVICQDVKERATMEPTATPNLITTDSLIGATPDVNLSLLYDLNFTFIF